MKHIMIFVAYVFMGAVLVVGIEFIADIEVPSGMSITLGMVGSVGMAWSFTRDHNRVPTKSEKPRLVIGAFTVMTVLSFLFAGMLLAFDVEFQQVIAELSSHWQIMLLVLAIAELIYFAMIWFSFGFFASTFLKQQNEKASATNKS